MIKVSNVKGNVTTAWERKLIISLHHVDDKYILNIFLHKGLDSLYLIITWKKWYFRAKTFSFENGPELLYSYKFPIYTTLVYCSCRGIDWQNISYKRTCLFYNEAKPSIIKCVYDTFHILGLLLYLFKMTLCTVFC